MIDTQTLSVIIPAHNEERRIAATLFDLRTALPGAEIIVVVNDSSDRTAAIVRDIARADDLTRVIDVPARIGKGGAVRIGFGLATKPYVAFVDADGATSGAEIRRLLGFLAKADCVVASRWLTGAQIDVRQSTARRILGRGFNLCVRLLFGIGITDTQCGAKLFWRDMLVEILDEIETADFAFDVDLLFAVHRRNGTIREVPTVWSERPGSSVKVRAAVPRMFLSLVRLRLRHSVLRGLVPFFDRSFRLSPIRSRRALRYLVLAPADGRSPASRPLERHVRSLLDRIESPTREIVWHATDAHRWLIPAPRWMRTMFVYMRRFRDDFDCVLEVLPGTAALLTPMFCMKPKVVITDRADRLPAFYSSTLVIDGELPSKSDLEQAMMLAMARASTHLYVDADGHLVLCETVAGRAIRELRIVSEVASA